MSNIFCMDANATITLKPVGDVELWYAEGAHCAWRFPLHVEWKQDAATGDLYGLVIPGLCLYHVQLIRMHDVLGAYSLEDRNDRWLVPKSDIERLLRKAPGIHAEFYYVWPGEEQAPASNPLSIPLRQPRSQQINSFAEFVSIERGLPSDMVNVVLTAVAQVGAKWLVRHRRPIDLGFVRLLAVPFRANWKEIVLFKGRARSLIKTMLLPKSRRLKRLAELRFPALLSSPHNIGLVGRTLPQPRLEYCVEAVTTAEFETEVDSIEADRMSRGNYVEHYTKTIERLYEHVVEVMAVYTRKVMASWAAVRKGSLAGGPAFVATRRHVVRDVPLSDLPVYSVPVDSDFSVFAEKNGKGKEVPLHPEADEMQAMSALPSATDDVRKRGSNGHMDEPRPGGADGLLLLDASEGAGAGQPMLSRTQAKTS